MKINIRVMPYIVISILILILSTTVSLAKPNDKKPELPSGGSNHNDFFGEGLSSDPDKINPLYVGLGIFCQREDNRYVIDANPNSAESYVIVESGNVPEGSPFAKDISIEFFPKDDNGKIKEKYLAYEGICQLMAALTFNMQIPFPQDFFLQDPGVESIRDESKVYPTNALGSEWNAVVDDEFKKEINWDRNPEQCLGQAINDAVTITGDKILPPDGHSKFYGYNPNTFVNEKPSQACCGDDYIWIMNKEINYQQNKQNTPGDIDNKCLYSASGANPEESGGYTCNPTAATDNLPYDGAVLFAGYKETHFSYGKDGSDRVTDVGLTYVEGIDEPFYCHTWFDPDKGTQFAWMTWKEVVDNIANKPDKQNPNLQFRPPKYVEVESRNPHNNNPQTLDHYTDNICNLYLGGKFTGTYCCGAGKTSNPAPLDTRSYNDPQETHKDAATLEQVSNGACVLGKYVDYKTIFNPESAIGESFIGVNGSVWICDQPQNNLAGYVDSYDNNAPLIKEGNNKKACEFLVTDDTIDVPDAANPDLKTKTSITTVTYCSPDKKWETFSFADAPIKVDEYTTIEKYTSDKPHSSGFTNPEDGKSVTLKETSIKLANNPAKELPVDKTAVDFKDSQCCFNGGCWDGKQCTPAGKTIDIDNQGAKEVYGCFNSQWHGPLQPTYNWYNDTFKKDDFCFMEYSCTCPDEDNYGEKEACEIEHRLPVVNSDGDYLHCTNKPFYFKQDHLCEPVYEASAVPYQEPDGPLFQDIKVKNSFWTSRTKLLAFTLMETAKDKDYTLFCDLAENSLNTEQNGETTFDKDAEKLVNSFCSLETTDGKRYLGVSLNPGKEDDYMTIDLKEILFKTPGFLWRDNYFSEQDLENSEDACDSAFDIGATDSFPYGEYGSCDNGKKENIWFNNRTKTVIYSKDTFAPSQLTVEMVNKLNKVFKDTNEEAHKFINGSQVNKEKLKEKVNIEDNTIYTYTSDFNRLFIAKRKGIFKVFGVAEQKVDPAQISKQPKQKVVYYSYILYYNDLFPMNTQQEAESTCKLIDEVSPDEDLYCVRGIGNNAKTIILPKIDNKNPSQHWQDLTATLRVTLS